MEIKNNFIEEILSVAWPRLRTKLINPKDPYCIDVLVEVANELYGVEVAYELHKNLLSGVYITENKPLNYKKLKEDFWVKNKQSGNVYTVKNQNPEIHTEPSRDEIEAAKKEKSANTYNIQTSEPTSHIRTAAELVGGFSNHVITKIKNWTRKEKEYFQKGYHNPGSKQRRAIANAVKDKLKGAWTAVKDGFKHEYHTFKTAAVGVSKFFKGEKLNDEEKSSLKKVAIKIATTALFAAVGGGVAHGATAFAKHVAIEFVPHVVGETLLIGASRAALFADESGEAEIDLNFQKFGEMIADGLENMEIGAEQMEAMVDSYEEKKKSGEIKIEPDTDQNQSTEETPKEKPDEEDPLEKDLESIKFGMMTGAEKEAYLKKKYRTESIYEAGDIDIQSVLDSRILNPDTNRQIKVSTGLGYDKASGGYQAAKAKMANSGISDDEIEKAEKEKSTKDDIEQSKQKRDASKQKLERGEFDPEENQKSLDSFVEVGFGDSKGAPGSPGSMLNEIVSISSATDSFNSGKPFNYDSQLESNVNKLKGTGLGDENDGDTPPSGVTLKEARAVAEKYGVSVGLAGKCIIATRAAQSKNAHITERIVNKNGLKNPKATPFFGDKDGLKAQENMINSASGRVMLGNTEISKEKAVEIIRSGGGGANPSDTAIFITDEETGDVYMTFYSDKDNVNTIVAQSSLRAEGELKKKEVDKLVEEGKLTKERGVQIQSAIDASIAEHEALEAELNNVTTDPAKHLLEQDPSKLADIAKTASAGREPDKYWKKAVVNQLMGSRPNKAMLAELPDGHSNPPTDAEMMIAFVKYANNPNSTLSKDQQRLISDMNKATNGPKIGSKIGEIRKKTIESDLKMLNKLNRITMKLDDGTEVGMGNYLEAESLREKLHLDMMFGGEGVYSDPDAFYQESGGVKVDNEALKNCMPFSNKNDMISHFEVGEEREITKRGSDVITGGSKIVYVISKGGERIPIGEKRQRSKEGDLGKLLTVYNYHPKVQECFKKNK
jgi:hypothetical protein